MKIGILGTRGIPNSYGGFEQFAEHLALGLLRRGHNVFVYTSNLNPYKDKEWHGVNLLHCKDWEDKLGTAGQFIYDLNCVTDARKQNFDVLLHLGYTSDSIWHRRWPRESINIVNMDGLEWKRSKYSQLARKFLKKAEAWAVASADYLVADSTEIRNYLLETYNKSSTFIPYGADIFEEPDVTILGAFDLEPYQYHLVVARLEPENNIKMIIEGYLNSSQDHPLLIVGNISNRYGKNLVKKTRNPKIKFVGGIYDKKILNNLRHFSKIHFHGHSVGGTNPSLLEAMACGCRVIAHDNVFNRAVLQSEADYFSTSKDVSLLLDKRTYEAGTDQRGQINLEKVRSIYNWDKVISDYEKLMKESLRQQQ